MVYRGIYREGVIVPDESLSLPEGARVDFDIVGKSSKAKKKVRKPGTTTARKRRTSLSADDRVKAVMKGFGIMRDHPDWQGKSTAVIANELRMRALGDRFRA